MEPPEYSVRNHVTIALHTKFARGLRSSTLPRVTEGPHNSEALRVGGRDVFVALTVRAGDKPFTDNLL